MSNQPQGKRLVDICGEPLKTRWHDQYNCAPWWMFWDRTSGVAGGFLAALLCGLAVLAAIVLVVKL